MNAALTEFLDLDAKPSRMNKPEVLIPSGDVQIRDTASALGELIAPHRRLFLRFGVVVELVDHGNGPALEEVTADKAQTRFEAYCRFWAFRVGHDGKQVKKPTSIPVQVTKAILVSKEFCDALPRISLVSASAILTPEADVLGHGYHSSLGGVLIATKDTPPDVLIEDAVAALAGLVQDFAFATPGDRARCLASFLVPAMKAGGHLSGPVPLNVVEADQSQSGKTYLQKIVRAIYGEQAYPIAKREGGVGSLDESLGSAMLSGKTFITLDNMRGKLNSQILEMAMTWGKSVAVRVPHRGEVAVDPSRVCFQLTSNGVETTPDLANRSSIVRIQKQREGYQFTSYDEGDLLRHVEVNQSFYLGCVFAVIGEWLAADRPSTKETRHDFREWAGALDWIVQTVFEAGPLLEGHREAQRRVSDMGLTWLRQVAVAVTADPMDQVVAHRASDIRDFCIRSGIEIPGVQSEDRAIQTIGSLMARAFKDSINEQIHVDRYTISRTSGKDDQHRPVHYYQFRGAAVA